MSLTLPRLSRSIPFWVLVVGSVVALAGGTYLLVSKLDTIATMITNGTATGVEVYAGQIWAVFGAILIGSGLIGLALALTLGTLRAFAAPAEIAEPLVWEEEIVEIAPVDAVAEADAEPVAPAASVVDEPAVDDTPAAEPAADETAR